MSVLVVAEVRERLAATNQATRKFSVRKLNEAEGKEQYQVRISNRFAGLENLADYVNLNRTWKINNSTDCLHLSDSGEK
jgi:hypothetical protein